jgi:hypothetical protein
MVRAHSWASARSVTPGNRRRSSIAADNSPPRSKAARIAAASAASQEPAQPSGRVLPPPFPVEAVWSLRRPPPAVVMRQEPGARSSS